MTSVLNVDTIAAKNGTSPVELLKQSAAKVFSYYDQSDGSGTLEKSLNVSSADDDGTGKQGINFTNNMSSANYGALADHHNNNNDGAGLRMGQVHDTASDGVRVHTGKNSGSDIVFEEDGDFTQPVVHIMGDLA